MQAGQPGQLLIQCVKVEGGLPSLEQMLQLCEAVWHCSSKVLGVLRSAQANNMCSAWSGAANDDLKQSPNFRIGFLSTIFGSSQIEHYSHMHADSDATGRLHVKHIVTVSIQSNRFATGFECMMLKLPQPLNGLLAMSNRYASLSGAYGTKQRTQVLTAL